MKTHLFNRLLRVATPLLVCFFSLSTVHSAILTLDPSSFGRIQDNITLGSNSGTTDAENSNAGLLYVGDHANNNSVYHVGYKFDLNQDWSFLTEEMSITLTIEITGSDNGGWGSISLYHVPNHTQTTVTRSIIVGGTVVETVNSGLSVGSVLEFDITEYVKADIDNNRDFSTFRISPETLTNNGNSLRNSWTLSSEATLAVIPEPTASALILIAGMAIALRRRRAAR